MELIYLLDKNEYETHLVKKKKEYILYSWNTLKLYVNEWQGGMLILDSKKLNIETFFDEKKRLLYRCLKLDEESYKDFMPYQFKGIKHCLMNTSMIDEKWCYPILRKLIKPDDEVCVLAFSFFNDTKNSNDWDKQYAKGQGIWYRSNTDVFFKYGLKENQIHWVNYFKDSKEDVLKKVLCSSILLLTGGAPDLMMKRIKEFKLKKILKSYQGLMIGYSAGVMIQLKEYHITPDEDYPTFQYLPGLGCIEGFKIEVHYHASNIQKQSIERVLKEKGQPVYAIYEDGGLIVHDNQIESFGHVDLFE